MPDAVSADEAPSAAADIIAGVLHVRLICSDGECTEEFEALGRLEELEALACECGCGLVVIGWLAEIEPKDHASVELIPLAA